MVPVIAASDFVRCGLLDHCETTLRVVPEGDPVFVSPAGRWEVNVRVENTGDQPTEECRVDAAKGGSPRLFL